MAAKTSKGTTTKRTTKKSDAPPAIATTTTAASTTENVVTRTPTTEEIQRRAFELFVSRGRQHGRAQDDWLTAERELRARYSVS